jgi:hypothetical protein
VDVQIGSIETVIESAGSGTDNRDEIIAMAVQVMRAELARMKAEDSRREADSSVRRRSFGQRY